MKRPHLKALSAHAKGYILDVWQQETSEEVLVGEWEIKILFLKDHYRNCMKYRLDKAQATVSLIKRVL